MTIPLTLRLVKGAPLTYQEGDDNFTNLRDGVDEVILYTNLTPVPVGIGGIPSGATFSNLPIQTVLDSLLYPYQVPAFTAFSISGQGSPLEVGATSNANPSFTWLSTNPTNITTNSVSITDTTSSTVLVSGHSITPPAATIHAGITKSTATSESYQISATNTHSTVFTRTYNINWQWRVFYGETTTTPLLAADVAGLRVSGLQSGFAGTYNFVAAPSEYKYLCYPSSMGTATSFVDQGTGLDVPFNTLYVVSITNSFGITTNYNVHGTVFMIGSALTVVVS